MGRLFVSWWRVYCGWACRAKRVYAGGLPGMIKACLP